MKKTILIFAVILIITALGIIITLFVKSQDNYNLETKESEVYISCGCGCCAFDEPLEEIAKEECLYKSKGESIQDKIDQDQQLSPELCATVGCSFPVKYIYCD